VQQNDASDSEALFAKDSIATFLILPTLKG
jgi:hypothetical protein